MGASGHSPGYAPSHWEPGEDSDPYAILGVSHHATTAEIKRCYREKVKACHPDLGSEPGRDDAFRRVTWAYGVLARIAAEESGKATSAGAGRSETGSDAAAPAAARSSAHAATSAGAQELLGEGWERLAAGAREDAEIVTRLALRQAPHEPVAYVQMAETLSAQGRHAEAIGCLILALHLDPRCSAAREALARLRGRSHGNCPGDSEKV